MRAALLLASIAAAAVVEAILLRRIVFHEAGGWATPSDTLASLLVWAAVPLVGSAVLIGVALVSRRPLNRIARAIAVVTLAGPIFGYIALAQYSHSTPGFMMVGLAVQCVAVLVAAIKLMPPNSTLHADARASSVLDKPPSARAGERGR